MRFHLSRRSLLTGICLALVVACARAADSDALAITANIEARHLPFGTVIDPVYAGPTSDQIVRYTRCGDSALWTGHYLAAEAFRYNVTGDAGALANVKQAIAGIQSLVDVTGTDLLARCVVPAASPYAAAVESEEAPNGIHANNAAGLVWVGNTSRDEYSGVMFGLVLAYDLVNDAGVQSASARLITRMINFLEQHAWTVAMPDGSLSTTFVIRPDEMLTLLEIGRHVNPNQFAGTFDTESLLLTAGVLIPVGVDVSSNSSYFKFNLDYINFYNLVRLAGRSAPQAFAQGYQVLRAATAGHQNAFFNMIDRALNGPNGQRDDETVALLAQWLERPRRDFFVNLQTSVPVCGSEACRPVPVPLRPPTDFLWQRDPFQLWGGGTGTIENAGIDYILPYWMARYYGVLPQPFVQSSAGVTLAVAPGSLASLYGSLLAGTTLTVTDSAGAQRTAALLYVSPQQINFIVPEGTAPGMATFTAQGSGSSVSATAMVASVAPALFSMGGNGTGIAAATAVTVNAADPSEQTPAPLFTCDAAGCTLVPLAVGTGNSVYLSLYGTGIRNAGSKSGVMVSINGTVVPVHYVGPQTQFTGLDQINVTVPPSLQGSGTVNVVVTVNGQTANAVQIAVQ